jgi:hypothetical protein
LPAQSTNTRERATQIAAPDGRGDRNWIFLTSAYSAALAAACALSRSCFITSLFSAPR